jgi:cold shock CspA family protein
VRLEIAVPGGPPVVVSRAHQDRADHDDAYVAIRDAFNAAKRQLQDRARKQRGDIKRHEAPAERGRIWHLVGHARGDQGDQGDRYGFILSTPGGAEVYFHENALVGVDYDSLELGTQVIFVTHDKEGIKGPQASTVKLANP